MLLHERFPTPSEPDLVVLAAPSAAFDPCALELYSRCMGKLPVGVPQGMNPLGEWFKDVLRKVTHYATPVLRTLGALNPAFGAGADISQAINGWIGPKKGKRKGALKGKARPPPVPNRPKPGAYKPTSIQQIRARDEALSKAIVPYKPRIPARPPARALPRRLRPKPG